MARDDDDVIGVPGPFLDAEDIDDLDSLRCAIVLESGVGLIDCDTAAAAPAEP